MSRIPDHVVEKVHLGIASPAERERVASDPDARERLAALPAQDAAFFEKHPVEQTMQAIEARARVAAAQVERRTPPAVWFAAPMALAAAALLVFGIAEDPTSTSPTEPAPVLEPTTEKGQARSAKMLIYRQRSSGPERLVQGSVARPGDTVQVTVLGAGSRHGVVLSVDGRGTVTLHSPDGPDGSTELASGEHRLPHAYLLDDAPNYERFFLVTSPGPTNVRSVLDAAEALVDSGRGDAADLVLPDGYHQTSTLVRKVN